jgi:hypothetical protein
MVALLGTATAAAELDRETTVSVGTALLKVTVQGTGNPGKISVAAQLSPDS